MRLAIENALLDLRGPLVQDGGDIRFVDYYDHIVYVRLVGACAGCQHAPVTMEHGIKKKLIERFSEIEDVINVA